ncbi:hypothetical protein CRG98_028680 [Punica granatum]|uniref:Neprosin PEP catalytic domain-containing protein n=1 Tax=Punica granatum TaxID=22663 RepID=A0A2I0J4V7_PUNGR|nr:hypothetical protein CRG98_028680 [Punica granatum]
MAGPNSGMSAFLLFVTLNYVILSAHASRFQKLTKEEDLELERRLKVINKPARESFKQADYGAMIDCIDIYKQLAFDHPLLKNHKIQMKPGKFVDGVKKTNPVRTSLPAVPQINGAVISIVNGLNVPGQLNNIQTGWLVNPYLYKNYTRLFTLWTADSYHKTGCYNVLCPGFLQVSMKIPLGLILRPTSDKISGNWWLKFGDEDVRYWAKSLFMTMANGASHIAWGGMVYSPSTGGSPLMASGLFPHVGLNKTAYIAQLLFSDQQNNFLDSVDGNLTWNQGNSSEKKKSRGQEDSLAANAGPLGWRRSLSAEEDLEFEGQLRAISKPAVKSFKMEPEMIPERPMVISRQAAIACYARVSHKLAPRSRSAFQFCYPSTVGFSTRSGLPYIRTKLPETGGSCMGKIMSRLATNPSIIQKLMEEEDLEIERLLKFINKPARLSFQPWRKYNESCGLLFPVPLLPLSYRHLFPTSARLYTYWTLSQYCRIQYETLLTIYQDQVTGNWWLLYGQDNELVGYWTKSLFNSLKRGASDIAMGEPGE